MLDLSTGDTARVSVDRDGAQSTGGSWSAALAGEGWHVGFASSGENLVDRDGNRVEDVLCAPNPLW